jgi:hypothetical protein
MPPRQMSSVPQQSQQTWQPQAQQQTQQVAYMYSNYQYAAPPQNQNGQFYQAYGYPAQPYAVYQTPNGQAYAYGYYPGGQGSVVYQQQPAMMYQMPMGQPQVAAPPMTQSRPPAAPIPPTSPAPAAPPVAPVTPAPPQPANEEPVHVTATNEPAVVRNCFTVLFFLNNLVLLLGKCTGSIHYSCCANLYQHSRRPDAC